MLISAIGSAAALLGACGGDHSNSDEQAQAAQAQGKRGLTTPLRCDARLSTIA